MRTTKTIRIITCDVCGANLEDGREAEAIHLYREVPCYHNDTSLEGVDVDLCDFCKSRLYKEVERFQRERKKEKPRG